MIKTIRKPAISPLNLIIVDNDKFNKGYTLWNHGKVSIVKDDVNAILFQSTGTQGTDRIGYGFRVHESEIDEFINLLSELRDEMRTL